ncbi:hypothetical protein, partial [Methyloceanibacter methanicus]|uniref:hypothetical protein n=1 Tax=Methyloceanibacter methanicus TaxID=1774968 RepID=UPI0019581B6A
MVQSALKQDGFPDEILRLAEQLNELRRLEAGSPRQTPIKARPRLRGASRPMSRASARPRRSDRAAAGPADAAAVRARAPASRGAAASDWLPGPSWS